MGSAIAGATTSPAYFTSACVPKIGPVLGRHPNRGNKVKAQWQAKGPTLESRPNGIHGPTCTRRKNEFSQFRQFRKLLGFDFLRFAGRSDGRFKGIAQQRSGPNSLTDSLSVRASGSDYFETIVWHFSQPRKGSIPIAIAHSQHGSRPRDVARRADEKRSLEPGQQLGPESSEQFRPEFRLVLAVDVRNCHTDFQASNIHCGRRVASHRTADVRRLSMTIPLR